LWRRKAGVKAGREAVGALRYLATLNKARLPFVYRSLNGQSLKNPAEQHLIEEVIDSFTLMKGLQL
jgi:hypothetical protein